MVRSGHLSLPRRSELAALALKLGLLLQLKPETEGKIAFLFLLFWLRLLLSLDQSILKNGRPSNRRLRHHLPRHTSNVCYFLVSVVGALDRPDGLGRINVSLI